MSQGGESNGQNRRTMTAAASLVGIGAAMVAAPVYVLLGEKGIDVSPAVWNSALTFCRTVTGLVGLLAIVSAVTGRRSKANRGDALKSVAAGVVFIASAVAGLGLVLVMTGLGGLALLWAGGAAAIGPFHSRHPESDPINAQNVGSFGRSEVANR